MLEGHVPQSEIEKEEEDGVWGAWATKWEEILSGN